MEGMSLPREVGGRPFGPPTPRNGGVLPRQAGGMSLPREVGGVLGAAEGGGPAARRLRSALLAL